MNKLFFILSLFTVLRAPAQEKWTTLSPEGNCTKRHECGFVAQKDNLYLVGGRGIKPIEKYSIKENTWTTLVPTPIEMHHITPVSVKGKIYIVGGLTGKYSKEPPLTHVYAFDPNNNSWEKLIEIPKDRRRGGAGVVVYKNKIYIVNGITFGHTSGTNAMFDVYDPKKNTLTVLPDAPHIRDHSGAAVVGNRLVALGGRNSSYHEPDNFTAFFATVKNTVDYFDFKTQKWDTYQTKLPAPGAGSGTVSMNGNVYYIGGETGEKPANNQVYALNPKTGEWVKKTFLNRARHGTNAVVSKGKIYIAAGSGSRGGGPELNSIEVYTE